LIFCCENQDVGTLTFMNRTSVEVREPIRRVTMPLFYVGANPGPCATSVLLQAGEKHFLITAAHIFDDRSVLPIPINLTDGVPGNMLIPPGEVLVRRSPTKDPTNRLESDPYDICICDLSRETAKRVVSGGEFRFLGLDELDPWAPEDLRSWYMVFGFPGDLNPSQAGVTALRSNALALASFIYGGEKGNIPWTDADRGVGILLDYGPSSTRDDAGQPKAPPAAFGLSGGGMWRIAEHGCDMGTWTIRDLKLIGIQSAIYSDFHVLRGTRIEHHLGLIYRGHPDLRDELERHFGQDECRQRFMD
jgi:hypothetical protein